MSVLDLVDLFNLILADLINPLLGQTKSKFKITFHHNKFIVTYNRCTENLCFDFQRFEFEKHKLTNRKKGGKLRKAMHGCKLLGSLRRISVTLETNSNL